MKLKVVIAKPGLWGLTKNDLRDAGRDAIYLTGVWWHENLKHHHFQIYAFGRYGYKPRAPPYERRKEQEHPEAEGRPNVWTGDSERSAMAGNKVLATARSWEAFHADVVVIAPKLNYGRRYQEIVSTTGAEDAQLANHFAHGFTREFLAIAETKPTIRLTAA